MSVKNAVKNSTFLITGGTGSFGYSVVEKLLSLSPKRIVIFSRDEKKQFDMRNAFDSSLLRFVIGDVRNSEQVNDIMENIDYVFHAAALKQVPTCEFFPMEAVQTNIIGAHNVVRAATAKNVKRVVVLSTDKAVYPINTMGMTKAVMEKIVLSASKNSLNKENHASVFCCVRYGNVLYTRGSVIPYFVYLIKQKKPLTVTNKNMTRFLLPLSDAVDLVLYALIHGKNGYTYVRKSPACTMETLAKSICELFDYQPGFKEVGIRAGEKLHETLISQEELLRAEETKNYYEIPSESQGLDYNKYFFQGKKTDVKQYLPFTSENTKRFTLAETKELLLKLPEMKKALQLMRK